MNYVGIDLGTTNSAICSYDGETVRLYKSREQHDVTPSAIFIDKRGNRYVGARAYNNAARNPDSSATLFKRLMGTSTPIKLPAVGVTLTPEECSAEILRTMFSYLPEELRADKSVATVITVPAAFNQMQKNATMSSAQMAGIGKVALMQEPVAAVMSVMRQRKSDGVFLVYDLGGGTLDVAVAESIAGRVSLLAHGGIAMCGGRDFDRMLFDSVVKPWLFENFDLPEDLATHPEFKALMRMATWAGENAKIELSQKDEATISLAESESIRDRGGKEIYLDITLTRDQFNSLINAKLEESLQAARDTLTKAGLTAHDVERVVFVGGPTHYKPLRDKVAFELGIAGSTDVNPMTAVSEGAAVFAESIDWDSQSRGRKTSRGTASVGGKLDVTFNYTSRTPDLRARLVAKVAGRTPSGASFQVDSLDTGWSSGRVTLQDGATLDLTLAKPGENAFKIFVFDGNGQPIALQVDRIVISRTAASIDAIPASHSVGVEVKAKMGGRSTLDYLVKEGDPLPKKGQKIFKAETSLKAGGSGALRIKIWEGAIADPVFDNRFIGMMEIKGTDFDEGVIAAGADIVCDYEMLDSGNIVLDITIPSIRGSFHSGKNFYSRQEGQVDYSRAAAMISEQADRTAKKLDEIASHVSDDRINQARDKLSDAALNGATKDDPEAAKHAEDRVQEAKRLLALTRKDHLPEMRLADLERTVSFFNDYVRKHAKPAEASVFDNLVRTARRSVNGLDFEQLLDEAKQKNFMILWRQDWFVVNRFNWLAEEAFLFADASEHAKLVSEGRAAQQANDIDKLRDIVIYMDSVRIGASNEDEMIVASNLIQA